MNATVDVIHAGESAGGALLPRVTIEQIVARRNAALAAFDDAHGALSAAQAAVAAANEASRAAAPDHFSSYYTEDNHRNREQFLCKLDVAEADRFKANARRLVDIAVWSHIIEMTDLEAVMDKEAKDELRRDLHDDPPEVTVDNVRATLERFLSDSELIWRRGLANAFSNLDRRFRSHDGWKIGGRMILDYALDEWGHWSWSSNKRDTIFDVERAFFVLDGLRPPPNYGGLVATVTRDRGQSMGRRQGYSETEFFRCRTFKNGNVHLWFKRDDLVEKANGILAEYYGEVLADDSDEGDDSPLNRPKSRAPARYFGHFPTPDAAADKLVDFAAIRRRRDDPPFRVLEPSAGAGNLARRAVEQGGIVDCVEVQPHLAKDLDATGIYRRVIRGDFLSLPPNPVYDRVVMNPPFDLERDIDHVIHAMGFLKPDGVLVAIMSAGTEWRETAKSRAFRDRMASLNAKWKDLPAGSFSSVGTNVNTCIVRVHADGSTFGYW